MAVRMKSLQVRQQEFLDACCGLPLEKTLTIPLALLAELFPPEPVVLDEAQLLEIVRRRLAVISSDRHRIITAGGCCMIARQPSSNGVT